MDFNSLKNKLQSPYKQENWKKWLVQLFEQQISIETQAEKIDVQKSNAKTIERFAAIALSDDRNIAVLDIKTTKDVQIARNRVALREIAFGLIDHDKYHGLLVFYHSEDETQKDYRLSFISSLSVFDADGNFKKQSTHPKRFSFVLGANETCTTATYRLLELKNKSPKFKAFETQKDICLTDVTDAFSVEKLNNEFFNKYKIHYNRFWEYIANKPEYAALLLNTKETELTKQQKPIRDFVKKMLGRIVFLHFLQKKGWMGCPANTATWISEDKNFMQNLFTHFPKQEQFYSECLTTLFYETLNTKRDNDLAPFKIQNSLFKIPFLNGGLFDDDQQQTNHFIFPVKYFKDLFDFFEQYNFTIDENSPEEQEVGIDPEMLGHIFENLLEENKDKGAFYTPKDIVHYMCQESLIEYLTTWFENKGYEVVGYIGFHKPNQPQLFPLNQGRKGQLLIETEVLASLDKNTRKQIDRILIEKLLKKKLDDGDKKLVKKHSTEFHNALDSVKICDPAIGSGAFPMGLLHEIFTAKQTLHYFEHGDVLTFDSSTIKLNIIQNSIYGVDIDSGAVDIARLRFWLSLVVDETEPRPLPNLDFKIVCANTLISLGELKSNLFIDDNTIKQLENIRHNYFKASKEEKEKLAKQFKTLQNDLLKNRAFGNQQQQDILQKLYSFDPFKNTSCSWFDAWWMFGVKDGFDIVIGNPPYIQIQKSARTQIQIDLENQEYKTFEKTGDIYALFYEKGIQLLKENGLLCFITSNKWMRAGYGKSLRQYFIEHNPKILIDLGGNVFESATVDTNILLIQKSENQKQTKAVSIKNKDNFVEEIHNAPTMSFEKNEGWFIGSDLEIKLKEKIEKIGKPLKDWDVKIYRGVVTGLNEAFIINQETRDRLIAEDPKSEEIIKPILRGRDIKRYSYEWAGLYVICTFPALKINIDNYPAIKKHFIEFGKEQLEQSGKDLGNGKKSRKKTGNKWFETQDQIAYYPEFEKEKLVWNRITSEIIFSYVPSGIFVLDSTFFITGEKITYVNGLLNSLLLKWWIKNTTATLGEGSYGAKIYIELSPIPSITPSNQKIVFQIESLVEEILGKKKDNPEENTKEIEKAIDRLVYQLYELTEEDIQIISSSSS